MADPRCQTCNDTRRVTWQRERPGGPPALNEGPCPECGWGNVMVQPDVDDRGVPYCAAAECPSYDGGTCGFTGQGVSGVCVPAVRHLVHVRRERDEWKRKALASNREAWEAQQALALERGEAVDVVASALGMGSRPLSAHLHRHDNRLLDLERRVDRLEKPEGDR